MSNKTSDKNVGSVEKDIRNIKQYINLVLDKGYCDCNELNVISTGKYCDGSKNVAYSMQNILAEFEQKDKRIQELEEEKVELKEYNKIVSDRIVEYKKNSIPKQVVEDKIKQLKQKAINYGHLIDKDEAMRIECGWVSGAWNEAGIENPEEYQELEELYIKEQRK